MKRFAISHIERALTSSEDRYFHEGLTRWNYFPNQKSSATELPPNITTRRLTPEVAKILYATKSGAERGRKGFDLIEYRATRYNNIPRSLGLIHPLAYSKIFEAIEHHRADLVEAMSDENSAIQMGDHLDGRLFIMNYEDPEQKTSTTINNCFGKRFLAHSDISNCFGSIYTHSLEWAGVGLEESKAKLGNNDKAPKHWSAALDSALQLSKRKETVGIPIGPATSSIAVEVILAKVDQELRKEFNFVRYIDDYTAYCESHEEAQRFLRSLDKEISHYRLTLNLAKTSIVELPVPLEDRWIAELMTAAMPMLKDDGSLSFLSTKDAIRFLDYAVQLNNNTPDGSVIKYAVSTIVHRISDQTAFQIFQYITNLSWHYPVLLPFLEKIDVEIDEFYEPELVEKLNSIIEENASHRRSDGICWALYYLEGLRKSPSDKAAKAVIESQDCISIAMLSRFPEHLELTVAYAAQLIEKHIYVRDKNWLLLYQLYYADLIDNAYPDEKTFSILKQHNVDFFCAVGEYSKAEQYSQVAFNPFADLDEIIPFEEWLKAN